ncbi:conjugal transfer protein TraG [Alteromonas sp. KUL42]|uniref:conjugal transfer protein TraG N-terminal domain-containing protein n=1 Tax=Alteromonas sp. KUL42 TaxID=2480797 RepID=UPI0010358F5F|nr:conjugal transfer protein TraG N-terminal domain-containing protein [Alteromonas sp. KUL42]TAP31715.1 hypothetical protein EYR97_19700 [Alteromonas sp. KUL42]GEA09148.1 conjugal transfer protein TraG [Alteromonas sp. KUL42]
MTFTSVSDLYFISVGVYTLNILWGIIVDSQLLLLPLIFIFLEVMKDTSESGKAFSDSGFMLKRLEVKIYLAMFSILFFAWPLVPFKVDNMTQYTKQCEDTEAVYIEEDISLASPYRIQLNPNDILVEVSGSTLRMPVGLQMVMSYMTGYSVEAINRLPCSINVTAVSQELLNTRIKDPFLLVETKEFIRQCFVPAKSLVVRQGDRGMPWIEDPDTSDQPWPGHAGFMNDAYYGNVGRGFYSHVLLEGWQGARNNQNVSKWVMSEMEGDCGGACIHEIGGFPSCREWWQGIGSGFSGVSVTTNDLSLRSRLVDHLPVALGENNPIVQRLAGILDGPDWLMSESTEDKMLRLAYFNPVSINRIRGAEVKDYGWESESNGLVATASRIVGTVGTFGAVLGNFAGASMIQLAAPIAKGALIFAIVACLPLALIVSQFGLKFTVGIHFFIGSVMFWPFLWEISLLLQQSLIESTMRSGDLWVGDITRPNTMLLGQYLTDGLFLGFPTIFTALLTAAGMQVGAQLGNVASDPGGSAGSAANKAGSKTQKEVMSKGKKPDKVDATKGKAK